MQSYNKQYILKCVECGKFEQNKPLKKSTNADIFNHRQIISFLKDSPFLNNCSII